MCSFVTVCECVHVGGGPDDALAGKTGIWAGFPEMTEKIRNMCMHQPSITTIRKYDDLLAKTESPSHVPTTASHRLRVLYMLHVCAYACTCVAFLAIWSLYVSLLLILCH